MDFAKDDKTVNRVFGDFPTRIWGIGIVFKMGNDIDAVAIAINEI